MLPGVGRTPVRYGVGMATDLRSRLGMPAVRAPLPVASSLLSLFTDGGVVRGRTVACTGDAALSAALAVSAAATRVGSWLAVVGVPHLGVGAAVEAGVAIERLILAQPPSASREWVTTVAALVEGFDVLIVAPPASLTGHDARRCCWWWTFLVCCRRRARAAMHRAPSSPISTCRQTPFRGRVSSVVARTSRSGSCICVWAVGAARCRARQRSICHA